MLPTQRITKLQSGMILKYVLAIHIAIAYTVCKYNSVTVSSIITAKAIPLWLCKHTSSSICIRIGGKPPVFL